LFSCRFVLCCCELSSQIEFHEKDSKKTII
jgi:hypothetical protein